MANLSFLLWMVLVTPSAELSSLSLSPSKTRPDLTLLRQAWEYMGMASEISSQARTCWQGGHCYWGVVSCVHSVRFIYWWCMLCTAFLILDRNIWYKIRTKNLMGYQYFGIQVHVKEKKTFRFFICRSQWCFGYHYLFSVFLYFPTQVSLLLFKIDILYRIFIVTPAGFELWTFRIRY